MYIHYNIQQKEKHMQAIFNSVNKKQLDSAYSSEDNNRSTVKRLFSSVFSIIDNDHQITDFNEETNKSKISKLLENDIFVSHLQNKLRNQGFCDGYNLPILRFSVKIIKASGRSQGYVQHSQLDFTDVFNIFQKFGQVKKIVLRNGNKTAYIFFSSFLNAYIAYKFLNNAKLRGESFEIGMDWVNNNDMNMDINGQIHNFISQLNWESLFQNKLTAAANYYYSEESNAYSTKQNKFTCRYDIQIQNQREFQVARRIIGSKGCHMKRILEESITNNENKNYSNDNANELLKLRLRGKGSGYKQGPQQQQSNENLHLCVSAKDQSVYSNACEKVEKLLTNIYYEYMQFTRKQGKIQDLFVKKSIIGQTSLGEEYVPQNNYAQSNECFDYSAQSYENMNSNIMFRITPQKISELLELRNKARRELNFAEADRIRNYLRNCGVCLVDQKGRRGKATEVTTWKYLY